MFFVTSLNIGGSEKACVRLANALTPLYDVTVCTLFGGGELQNELSDEVRVRNAFPHFVRGVARVVSALPPKVCRRLFADGGYDVEIAVGDGLESHILSGGKNENKFAWIHMDVRFHGNKASKKTDKRYSSFKKIICVSDVAAKGFAEKYGFADKTAVAYTPVDFEEIRKMSDESSDVTCPFEGEYYVSVGRLEAVKGFSTLIDAVKDNENIKLVVIGDGTLKDTLSAQIEREGLRDRVALVGASRNPYPSIKNAKAYVCSSLNESFGFAPVEAMSLGVPVISVRCGGVEEILNEDNIGILCDNSAEGLQKAIADFDCGRISSDTCKAMKRARDFSAEKCLPRFIDIIS